MENREFISAATLPTTEAEEVDVLCVENGELKRRAGASLGGGNYDAVILVEDYNDGDGNYTYSKCTLESGSYADVLAKLKANELVKVALHGRNFTYGCEVAFCVESVSVNEYTIADPAEDGTYPIRLIYFGGDSYRWSLYWHSNDMVNYYSSQTAAVSLLSDVNHAPGRN